VADSAKPKKPFLRDTLETIVSAFLIALFIRTFFFTIFFIPSGSMIPTLNIGDRLIVSKLSFGIPNPLQELYFKDRLMFVIPNPFHGINLGFFKKRELVRFGALPKRFEVIVFKAPLAPAFSFHEYKDPKTGRKTVSNFYTPFKAGSDYIKRVIGLPGETIQIIDHAYYINGKKLDEKYIPSDDITNVGRFLSSTSVVLGVDEYFVSGDNRPHSSDSREWGPIHKEEIVGRGFLRYWPLNRLGFIPKVSYPL
jgi:signal peptidase I